MPAPSGVRTRTLVAKHSRWWRLSPPTRRCGSDGPGDCSRRAAVVVANLVFLIPGRVAARIRTSLPLRTETPRQASGQAAALKVGGMSAEIPWWT